MSLGERADDGVSVPFGSDHLLRVPNTGLDPAATTQPRVNPNALAVQDENTLRNLLTCVSFCEFPPRDGAAFSYR